MALTGTEYRTIIVDGDGAQVNPALPAPARRMVSATLTTVAGGNYDAGDVIGNDADNTEGDPVTFDAVVSEVGETAILDGVVAICSEDGLLCRLRLHFFNAVPAAAEVEMDDNAAFAITTSTKYLGSVTLPAFADRGAVSVAELDNIRKLLKCAAADDALYVVVETLDAETNETAAMTIRFDLHFLN